MFITSALQSFTIFIRFELLKVQIAQVLRKFILNFFIIQLKTYFYV